MAWLENIDQSLFLFLNGINATWLDPIMKAISSFWIWYPIVALFIFLVVRKYRKKFWIPIVVATICFAITDQTSTLVKKSTERYRPTHNIEIAEKVHIIDNYRGGQYGFFSGHAANSFGLALVSLLFLKNKKWTIFVLVWAALVSYSRIYIGVHYPSDIFAGTIVGLGLAYIIYKLHRLIPCFRTDADNCTIA
jgi:undecaprenyl-diphosphatase